jgi:hypothetical protein
LGIIEDYMRNKHSKSMIFLIIFVVYGIGRLLYNVAYLEPKNFRSSQELQLKAKNPTLSDSIIKTCVNCIYKKFEKRYGYPGFFPKDQLSSRDSIDVKDCIVQSLPFDSMNFRNQINVRDSLFENNR